MSFMLYAVVSEMSGLFRLKHLVLIAIVAGVVSATSCSGGDQSSDSATVSPTSSSQETEPTTAPTEAVLASSPRSADVPATSVPTATPIPPSPIPVPTSTPEPSFRSCDEIRAAGDYLSPEERNFFLGECIRETKSISFGWVNNGGLQVPSQAFVASMGNFDGAVTIDGHGKVIDLSDLTGSLRLGATEFQVSVATTGGVRLQEAGTGLFIARGFSADVTGYEKCAAGDTTQGHWAVPDGPEKVSNVELTMGPWSGSGTLVWGDTLFCENVDDSCRHTVGPETLGYLVITRLVNANDSTAGEFKLNGIVCGPTGANC